MTDLLDWTPPIEDRPAYNENGWRDIASEFKKFHRKNPEIFKLFTRFSNEAFDRGLKHYSSDAVLHRIRWFTTVENPGDPDGVKINNNWTSFYSRLLAAEDPKFRGFFKYRKSKADALLNGENK